VQATIVNLLADLRDEFDLSYLFISHDLAVVAQLSDRIAVMYRGRICEVGTAADVLAPPYHPYTRMLLASVGDDDLTEADAPADPMAAASDGGCVFAARCPQRIDRICDTIAPPTRMVNASHAIACHLEMPIAEMSAAGAQQEALRPAT
jgi:peptide/nickel transport system ATP-binding protein